MSSLYLINLGDLARIPAVDNHSELWLALPVDASLVLALMPMPLAKILSVYA